MTCLNAKELYDSENFAFLINAEPAETGYGKEGEVTEEDWKYYSDIYTTAASQGKDVLPYLCRVGNTSSSQRFACYSYAWVLICEYCDYVLENQFDNDADAMIRAASKKAQEIAADEVFSSFSVYFGEDTGVPAEFCDARPELIVVIPVETDLGTVKEVVKRLGDMAYKY
jgi:hypothetical protein